MREENVCAVLFSALLIFTVLCLSADGLERCQSRSACFPGGIVPEDVPEGTHYMQCCLHKNTSMNYEKAADGTENCTCVPDFTLEGKIQKWADSTKDYGRMCNRGASGCSGSKSNATTNYKFLYCCWQGADGHHVSSSTTTFDGDKEEYIGCRCANPIPSPDPTAYTVPQTSLYNSTGEVCSYDKGCEDRPALKCTSPGVTFCCYGSRGIVTDKDGGSLTRCTCTNQVYGEMCKSTAVPIEQTKLPCLTDCSNRDDDDVCRDSGGNERCCEHNMAVSATLLNGNFTDCTCTMDTVKSCEVTFSAASSYPQSLGQLLVMLVSIAVVKQWYLTH